MTATREHQSFVGQITDAYLSAAVFALDSQGQSLLIAERTTEPAQRYCARLNAAMWEVEADRCDAIATALAEMVP